MTLNTKIRSGDLALTGPVTSDQLFSIVKAKTEKKADAAEAARERKELRAAESAKHRAEGQAMWGAIVVKSKTFDSLSLSECNCLLAFKGRKWPKEINKRGTKRAWLKHECYSDATASQVPLRNETTPG